MKFHSNMAAVHFMTKNYDSCASCCEKAMEVGKTNMAPYLDRAKCLTR